jgi:hypothetical protein
MRKGAFKLVLLIAAIALLALLPAGASANSASGSVSFAGTATLVSNPGAAAVTLHYFCLRPTPGFFLNVSLDENGVFGANSTTPTCDGKTHTVTLTIPGAFSPGTAAGRAFLANGDFSVVATTQQKVLIK